MKTLNQIFLAALEEALRRPKLFLAAITAIVLSGFLLSSKLSQAVAIEDLLEPRLESAQDLRNMQKEFGSSNVLLATFKNVSSAKDLCELEVHVNEALISQPFVESFQTPLQLRQATFENGQLIFERITPNPCEPQSAWKGLTPLIATPWGSILSNHKGTDYTVFVNFKEAQEIGPFGHFHPERVQQVMDQFQSLRWPVIYFSGNSAHDFFSFEGMQQGRWLNLAAGVFMLLGIRLFLGTWKAGLVYFLTLGGTMGIVLGGMAVFHHPIDLLTGCLFLMIMISTLQDFIFLSCEKIENPDRSLMDIFRDLLLPSFLTSLTTFIGFSTLMISDLGIIRRFGLWAAVASILEWLFVFYIFPCVVQQFGFSEWVDPSKIWRPKVWLRLKSWVPSRRVTWGLAVIVVIPMALWSRLDLTQTPLEMFPSDHIFQKALKDQDQEKGWAAQVYLQYPEKIAEKVRQTLIPALLQDSSIARIETWDEDSSFLLRRLQDPGLKSDLKNQMKVGALGEKFVSATGMQRAFVFLKTAETKTLNQLAKKVTELCGEGSCKLVGEYIAFADFSTHLIRTLFESLFLSLFLVLIVVVVVSQAYGVQNKIKLLISIFWGPATVMAVILLTGTHINVVTCIVASILVGLAGDNAIQYIFAGQGLSSDGITKRSSASMITAFLMTALSFVFLFSYFQPPRDLGGLLALGFLANLMGDLWILKGLLRKD